MDEIAEVLDEQLRPLKLDDYLALAELGAFDIDVAMALLEVFRAPKDGEWTEHFTLTATRRIRSVSFPDVESPLKDFLVALRSH